MSDDVPYLDGQLFLGVEASYRSKMSGDPSASAYTVIDGYTIVNMAVGYRQAARGKCSSG